MKTLKTIFAALVLVTLTISCTKNNSLTPSLESTSKLGQDVTPIYQDSILIEYVIHIKSVDSTKVTNLTNGMGYAHKVNGNWISVSKFSSAGSFIPVHKGQYFRGRFYIPIGLSNLNFQSQLHLLSSNLGDILRNPDNIATIEIHSNGVLIVDKRANGFDSTVWNYGRFDIGALVPISY